MRAIIFKKTGGLFPVFFFVCCLFFAAPLHGAGPQSSQVDELQTLFSTQPLLQIIYSAESGGELYPCARCGGPANNRAKNQTSGQIGGLARRAALLKNLRLQGTPLLQIIGPGEFLPAQGSETTPPRRRAALALQAYSALRPQAVYLSAAERAWLETVQKPLPGCFMPLEQNVPRSRVLDYGGRKIGLVFFCPTTAPPAGPDSMATEINSKTVRASAQTAALAEGRKLAGRVHLLIGVSPWGFEAERAFLPQAAGLYHILLGGGPGAGFAKANHSHSGQLLWSRPSAGGTAVNRIVLYRWPMAGAVNWEDGLSFEAAQKFLHSNLPEDREMARLLE